MLELASAQIIMTIGVLALLWGLESWRPFRANRPQRLRHAGRNLTLGLLNALVLAVIAGPLIIGVATWTAHSELGLLPVVSLPPLLETLLALLLLDASMYLWHRANHRVPLLWRFHRTHHSDPALDATSALRFHAGEILISVGLRLLLIPLLGITLWQVLLYDLLLMPVILFHHSNVRLPERIDRVARLLLVTPALHRVHHSRRQLETDSNYASILSWWDRLGRSFRLKSDMTELQYGLAGYDSEERQTVTGLLLTPWETREEHSLPHVSG